MLKCTIQMTEALLVMVIIPAMRLGLNTQQSLKSTTQPVLLFNSHLFLDKDNTFCVTLKRKVNETLAMMLE